MKLSVITTLYQSSPHLVEFHRRSTAACRQLAGDDYELILVNDGSPDDSLAIASALQAADPRVVIVDLSRNFGHWRAMRAGFEHAAGERIFMTDCDLEEAPELVLEATATLESRQADAVYFTQTNRKGGCWERFSGGLFYRIFNLLAGVEIPPSLMTSRLMTRPYLEAVLAHGESEFFLAGLLHRVGFHQVGLTAPKKSSSPSTYTFRKKLTLTVDAITNFSSVPLRGVFFLGLFLTLSAMIAAAAMLIRHFIAPAPVAGWTSIVISIWLFGGIQIFCLGVLGMYLSKIFREVKRRPSAFVRKIYRA